MVVFLSYIKVKCSCKRNLLLSFVCYWCAMQNVYARIIHKLYAVLVIRMLSCTSMLYYVHRHILA